MNDLDGPILVTGGDGFVGRHVIESLLAAGVRPDQIVATHRAEGVPSPVAVGVLDIEDHAAIDAMIGAIRPAVVIHLAARASVGHSLTNAEAIWLINVESSRILALAAARARPQVCMVFASSAEVYGSSFSCGRPLDESSPVCPTNPYARSKLAAELALTDALGPEAQLIVLRLFNHIGAGQGEQFAAGTFGAQLVRIGKRLQAPVIKVGDLSAERDFGDVRDAAAAIVSVVEHRMRLASRALFNVCSGRVMTARNLLDMMRDASSAHPEIMVDPARLRPIEIPYAAGDASALTAATGWKPSGVNDETISRILDFWRNNINTNEAVK